MRMSHQWTRCSVQIFAGILFLLSSMAVAAQSQTTLDFSGLWKQDNDRCQPKRQGDVTMRIDQREAEFTVETSISHGSASPRHAVQRYTTDGRISITTGADGDEFHTSIVRSGESLVFSIEEHEDDHIILSKETWTLIENGAVLKRVREIERGSPNGATTQTLLYQRASSQT